ncbi:hypothetical protein GE107_06260 [Cohnella sp. CFH 77786]|uniref:zinc ribbon domain-containing protein n=1 Tax=Cohnella sp. CFH 77786 TaxID=2662265 RepID=UPI001C60981B|nr:hypothetical protein [Cohnella sp. CFH 77786]MBW5445667.1 hypothetical protein [Cohnella sp. CFH 77786]
MLVFLKKRAGRAALAVLLLAALCGLYVVGTQIASESNETGTILDFEMALRDGDAARVAELLHADDDKVAIDEPKAERLMAFLNQKGRLEEALKGLRGESGDTGSVGRIFAIEKDGKRFGIFDRYRIVVRTSAIEVRTNYKGATVKLDGQPVATADSSDYRTEVGPLVPGSYRLEAEYIGKFATLKAERDVSVGGGRTGDPVDLSLNGEMVTVEANYDGAAIYIDGKDTGARTGGKDLLGPVPLDGTNRVHAEKEFPWGIAKSEPVPIRERTVRVVIDPNTEALKEAVMDAASGFIQSYMDAYNKLDPSAVRHSVPDKIAELASGIHDYKASGLIYEAHLKKLVFDTDSIYIQQEPDGSYRTAVSLQSTYDQRFYAAGETPPEPDEYTDTMTYRLVLKNGEWLVTDWYQDYDFNGKHTKVKTF